MLKEIESRLSLCSVEKLVAKTGKRTTAFNISYFREIKEYFGSMEKTTDKRTLNKYPPKSIVTGDR